MSQNFQYKDCFYVSVGSTGKCEICKEPGMFFDENGTYLCEDCLSDNHDQGVYDDDRDDDDEPENDEEE